VRVCFIHAVVVGGGGLGMRSSVSIGSDGSTEELGCEEGSSSILLSWASC
jgi:hypothetical protein